MPAIVCAGVKVIMKPLTMHRFENRVALITAAGSGVGRGVAFRLAAEGAAVTIWDRDPDALADVARDAGDRGLDLRLRAFNMTEGTGHDVTIWNDYVQGVDVLTERLRDTEASGRGHARHYHGRGSGGHEANGAAGQHQSRAQA